MAEEQIGGYCRVCGSPIMYNGKGGRCRAYCSEKCRRQQLTQVYCPVCGKDRGLLRKGMQRTCPECSMRRSNSGRKRTNPVFEERPPSAPERSIDDVIRLAEEYRMSYGAYLVAESAGTLPAVKPGRMERPRRYLFGEIKILQEAQDVASKLAQQEEPD